MTINYNGRTVKVKGIKGLCSASRQLSPAGYVPRWRLQVNLDTETGELLWADVIGAGYIVYHKASVVDIGRLEHPATMAEIREWVANVMADKEAWRAYEQRCSEP